jgi:hypothetical protein
MDQVAAVFEVNFHDYFAIAVTILQLTHDWEQVALPNRDFDNSGVVNTQSSTSAMCLWNN